MLSSNVYFFTDGEYQVAFEPTSMAFYRVNTDVVKDHLVSNQNQPVEEKSGHQPDVSKKTVENVTQKMELDRLVLIVTTHCNLRCRYCYAEGGNYGMAREQMTPELAKRAVIWASSIFSGIRAIQFFGGEPTLNSKAVSGVCDKCNQLHQEGKLSYPPQYAMVTNGTVLPNAMKELIEKHRIHLTFSIDGPQLVHDTNRFFTNGNGSYERVTNTLKNWQTAGKFDLGVEMTYTPDALKNGYGIWELAQFSQAELGMPLPHITVASATPDGEMSWNGNSQLLIDSYRLATKKSLNSILNGPYIGFSFVAGILQVLITKHSRNLICPAGQGTLAVDPQGDIYPCFMFAGQESLRVGNIDETSDFSEVAAKLKSFSRYNIKDNHQTCQSCWAKSLCTGCLGDTQLTAGSLEKESWLMCEVMKAVAEETMLFLTKTQSDPEAWKNFVKNYRQLRLDQVTPDQLTV